MEFTLHALIYPPFGIPNVNKVEPDPSLRCFDCYGSFAKECPETFPSFYFVEDDGRQLISRNVLAESLSGR